MCGALIKKQERAGTHIVGMWLFLSDFIGKLKDESGRDGGHPSTDTCPPLLWLRPPCHLPGSYRIPTRFLFAFF